MPIKDRIVAALREHEEQEMTYFELAKLVFPDHKSWKYQGNGGPPGCYMSLTRAITKLQKEGTVYMWSPNGACGDRRRIRLRI